MRARIDCWFLLLLSLAIADLGAAPAPKPATPAKTAPGAAKAEPVEIEIPQSVFVMPANLKEGRDPFFPNSDRVVRNFVVKAAPTNKEPPIPTLVLTGIAPSSDKPLAMINGKTFGKGEEGDITSAGGKIHIRVIEIKAESVIVEARGERRELVLRKH
jgi:hypothetical protein